MAPVFIAPGVVFLAVLAGMSTGYIITRKSSHGSCGGIANLGLEKGCDGAEPCDARKKRMAREEARREMLEKHRII